MSSKEGVQPLYPAFVCYFPIITATAAPDIPHGEPHPPEYDRKRLAIPAPACTDTSKQSSPVAPRPLTRLREGVCWTRVSSQADRNKF